MKKKYSWKALLAAPLLAVFAVSCGTAVTKPVPPPEIGTVLVSVAGAPQGLGSASLKGAGAPITITKTTKVEVPVGTYALSSVDIVVNGKKYTALDPSQPSVTVVRGTITPVSLSYERDWTPAPPTNGTLRVHGSGHLKDGSAVINVNQVSGGQQTTLLTLFGSSDVSVTPGAYALDPQKVETPQGTYTGAVTYVAGNPINVVAGQGYDVYVNYAFSPKPAVPLGSINFTVVGPTQGKASVAYSCVNEAGGIVTSSQVVGNLPSGVCTITATDVVVDGIKYIAQDKTQTVTVTTGNTSVVTVSYRADPTPQAPSNGIIRVEVVGAPVGLGVITINSSAGAESTVATLFGTNEISVSNGSYTVSAQIIQTAEGTYIPSVNPASVRVTGGNKVTSVVNYTFVPAVVPQVGAIQFTITGAPQGFGSVKYVCASNTGTVNSSALVSNLGAGPCTIAATDVFVEARKYIALDKSQSVTVAVGVTSSVTVSYVLDQTPPPPSKGTLRVQVGGDLGEGKGLISVSKVTPPENTLVASLIGSSDVSVDPGQYLVSALPVTTSAGVYTPEVIYLDGSPVTIVAGQGVDVYVNYTFTPNTPAPSGSMVVTITGLPQGSADVVYACNPSGLGGNLPLTTTISGIMPGTCTVTANPVMLGTVKYIVYDSKQVVTISNGTITQVTVSYDRDQTPPPSKKGVIRVHMDGGLTDGLGNITLNTLTGTTETPFVTLRGSSDVTVPVGTYTVVPKAVPGNGGVWIPVVINPGNVVITAGGSADVYITYKWCPYPKPPVTKYGSMSIDISGVSTYLWSSTAVTVTNSSGTVIKTLTAQTNSTNLLDLPVGIYTIKVRDVGPFGPLNGIYTITATVKAGQHWHTEVIYGNSRCQPAPLGRITPLTVVTPPVDCPK